MLVRNDGTDRFRDTASARRAVTGVGEPWTFGLRPEALPAYLEERGLRLVRTYVRQRIPHTHDGRGRRQRERI